MGVRSVRSVAFALVLALSGCGSQPATERAPTVPSTSNRQGGSGGANAPALALAQLPLGRDLDCRIGDVRLQVLANGQFLVDGTFVGTFTGDGGFYNVDGIEVGRLHPSGQITFAGALQDASIERARIVSPDGTLAFVDENGYFSLVGGRLPPAAVAGMTSAHVRTFLFAFSMFAALLDTAQRMEH